MSRLVISGLRASIAGQEILRGIDLEVSSGEVHAVMGPNGAGKSTLGNVLMGNPAYREVSGSVTLDGVELLGLSPWLRAQAGLYLAPQDPVELPGVPLSSVIAEALSALGRPMAEDQRELRAELAREADAIGVPTAMLDRALNVDASGGEKKRLETLQLAMLAPRIAILDELDSGLDVDALRDVARRVDAGVRADLSGQSAREPLGVLVITHYRRLLTALLPDVVHVLVQGRIVASGGAEFSEELEANGYAAYLEPSATN